MKIYLSGVPGAGKSSVAKAIAAKGVLTKDIDDGLCEWMNLKTGMQEDWEQGSDDEWYDSHGWICNIEELKQLLTNNKTILVVGAATNQSDFLRLFDKIIVLQVKPETIVTRLNSRTDNDFGKHPLEKTHILNWQKTFEAEMIEKGAISINANNPLSEVVEEVYSYFDFK